MGGLWFPPSTDMSVVRISDCLALIRCRGIHLSWWILIAAFIHDTVFFPFSTTWNCSWDQSRALKICRWQQKSPHNVRKKPQEDHGKDTGVKQQGTLQTWNKSRSHFKKQFVHFIFIIFIFILFLMCLRKRIGTLYYHFISTICLYWKHRPA